AHPNVTIFDIDSLPLAIYLVVGLILLPLIGNLVPSKVSFLFAMRYYAGNWAWNAWLFRGDSYRKLDRVKRASPLLREQLERFAPAEAASMDSRGMAFRSLHLQGRCLGLLLPRALGGRPFQGYSDVDGENVAGSVLGWNFGEGHLGDERLLACIQEQCHFEDGEVRAIMVESQPLLGSSLHWRILDAERGLLEEGYAHRDDPARRAPWDYREGMDDAVVVGSGPNGLAAAVELARAGASVLVLEGRDEIGGGTRSAALTLPGFCHDVCSGCHPMGILSPFFRSLDLDAHGLRWIRPPVSVAHPLDGAPAVLLRRSLDETARDLDGDADAYRWLFAPFLRDPHALLADLVGPLRVPRHPLRVARFGALGLLPATTMLRARFRGERARALLAGCAPHSILPLERPLSAAVAMIIALTGHMDDWPVAAGGSQAIARALASCLEQLGGRIETGVRVRTLADIPPARVVLFDTSPAQLAEVCAPLLPASYLRRLRRYRYGPGVFKLDWA